MAKEKEKTPEYSEPMKCGHCGNYAPMKEVAFYSTIGNVYNEEIGIYEEGYVYIILECPSCNKINLTSSYYHELMYDEENSPDIELLYPIDDKMPVGLNDSIKRAYEAAMKVRHIDANAYGVLIGRLLEMICEDRKAKGRDLHSKLSDLAARGEIPNNLVGVANGLRNLRNVGAHALLGELTTEEIPILSSLAKAILEYVYSAPYLARLAEEKLAKLKGKKKRE